MALTHVCMWSEKRWKRISANEAAELFPYGTSTHSGLFMCELCGQYVNLVSGTMQSNHFRHSAYEKNKECVDRSVSYGYAGYFQAEAHNLPIRIKILSSDIFSLEIGFISLPESIMKDQSDRKISISGAESFIYSFKRLIPGTVTYLDVGTKPASQYKISVSPSIDNIKSYWPGVVSGLDRAGTLFDKVTGKKLPYDADVQVGHEYYLVAGMMVYGKTKDLQCREVCSMMISWKSWRVYEIKATDFNEGTAKFFLNYHCRLTDEPVVVYPIWPVYVESPYVVYHKSRQIHLYFKGNAEAKLAPVGFITKYPLSKPKLLSITSSDRQQLLSVGRVDVLKYMYLWENELNQKGTIPQITVTDINGTNLAPGRHSTLPEKQTICITPEVDGQIIIYEDADIVEQYRLSAGHKFELDSIKFGQRVQIYQGLDCLWEAFFEKERILSDEKELLDKLNQLSGKKIKIAHSFGAVASEFEDMPLIQLWIYQAVRKGEIGEGEFKLLKQYM